MTNDRDARRSRLARDVAKRHRSHLLARIADGVVTRQRSRHAEQGLTGRAGVRQYRAPHLGTLESGSSLEVSPTGRIRTGLMWGTVSQICCAARAFPPDST